MIKQEDINGHYVHINGGELVTNGKFPTNNANYHHTIEKIGDKSGTHRHLVFYAHGGLNDLQASVNRIHSLGNYFLANDIYPIHFIWETDIQTWLSKKLRELYYAILWDDGNRASWPSYSDVMEAKDEVTDFAIERLIRQTPAVGFWMAIKQKADAVSAPNSQVRDILQEYTKAAENAGMKVHFVAHSAGANLVANLIKILPEETGIQSITLWAPASTVDFYNANYLPHLNSGRIVKINQLNLTKEKEVQDDLLNLYKKSLLELVSRGLESRPPNARNAPLIGLQRVYERRKHNWPNRHSVHTPPSNSGLRRHGDFDDNAYAIDLAVQTIKN